MDSQRIEGSPSSRNAMTHGLTARRPLHQDEADRMARLRLEWEAQLRPEDPVEEALVETAVVEFVRYTRCVRADEARIRPETIRAVRDWREKKQHDIRKLAQSFHLDPDAVRGELLGSAFGIDWMLRHWRSLLSKLDTDRSWDSADGMMAMHLIGRPARRPDDADQEAIDLCTLAFRSCPAMADDSVPPTLSDDLESIDALRAFVRDQIGALERLRPEVWESNEALEQESIEWEILRDTSPEGQLRTRYRREAYRDYHRSLRELDRRRAERARQAARSAQPTPPSPPKAPARSAPTPSQSAQPPDHRNDPPITARSVNRPRPNSMPGQTIRNASPARPSATDRRTGAGIGPRIDLSTTPADTLNLSILPTATSGDRPPAR